MYAPDIWAEMILEQKILHAAGQPTCAALITFGGHDPLTDADLRQALDSREPRLHDAVVLLAIESGYPGDSTIERVRAQLLGPPAYAQAGQTTRASGAVPAVA